MTKQLVIGALALISLAGSAARMSAAPPAASSAPIPASDLIGTWKIDDPARNDSFELSLSGREFSLDTSKLRAWRYTDWEPDDAGANVSSLMIYRLVTQQDVRDAALDAGSSSMPGLIEKIGQKIFGTTLEHYIKGDLKGKQIVSAVVSQLMDKLLEGSANREPFASIKAKLDTVISQEGADAAVGSARDRAAGAASTAITPADAAALNQYLGAQCRYQIVDLPGHGAVQQGVALVDTKLGKATVWTLLVRRDKSLVAVVGQTSVPQQGVNGPLHVHFSPM
jgi:hypothetical protein